MTNNFWKATALAAMLYTIGPAMAAGTVISITGNAAAESTVTVHDIDLSQLGALGETTLKTKVVSLPGIHEARGVLMRDLLKSLNLKGETVFATALDGYAVEIPIADLIKYDVILATKIDGKELSVRDKGPSWIIYPVSQHAELDDPVIEAKCIWQVKALTVK